MLLKRILSICSLILLIISCSNSDLNKSFQLSTTIDTTRASIGDLISYKVLTHNIGYKYFDECFGVTMDFERSFYEDRDLKPKDILTLMFSFKHLGAYKSTNIAESTNIRWNEVDVLDYGDFN